MSAIKHLQAGSGTWYWVVNFSRRGVHHERRLYEPKHGGKDAALRAAITWRDEGLAKAKVLGVLEFCQHKRSNNAKGVPGVRFLTPAAQPEGIWQAFAVVTEAADIDSVYRSLFAAYTDALLLVNARGQYGDSHAMATRSAGASTSARP